MTTTQNDRAIDELRATGDRAIDVLRATADGDQLHHRDLWLLEAAVNGTLTPAGQHAFDRLHRLATTNAYDRSHPVVI